MYLETLKHHFIKIGAEIKIDNDVPGYHSNDFALDIQVKGKREVFLLSTPKNNSLDFTILNTYKDIQHLLLMVTDLSVKKAAELTQNMYQISYMLPESKRTKTRLLKMDDLQAELYAIVMKNF